MRLWFPIAIATAVACGGKKQPPQRNDDTPEPTDKHGPTGKPHPQSKLDAKLDGKAVPMVSALAVRGADGEIHITVSSVPLGCDDIAGDSRWMYDGEVTFGVTEAQQLQPDGDIKPALTSWYYEGATRQESKLATGNGDGANGVPTTVDVDFEIAGAGKDAKKLAVKGTIDALGCPAEKRPKPMMSGQQPGKMTIAGKSFDLGNVMLEPGDWPTLVLTSGGETCKHNADEKPGEVVLRLTWFKKDDPQVSQIELGGTMLPHAMDQTFDKTKITLDPAPPDKIVQTKIKANITVMGYPVEIHGSVVPEMCSKK